MGGSFNQFLLQKSRPGCFFQKSKTCPTLTNQVKDTCKKEWELDWHKLEFINANGQTWLQNPSYFLCAYHIVTKSFMWNYTIQNKKVGQECCKKGKRHLCNMWNNESNQTFKYVHTIKTKSCQDYTRKWQTPSKNGIPRGGWFKWSKEHNPNLLLKVAHSLEVGHVKGLCKCRIILH
jgi:hypothetical protein